jgi:hypothetical protein
MPTLEYAAISVLLQFFLIRTLGPDEFLLAGLHASVFFHRPGFLPGICMKVLKAEQGHYTPADNPGSLETWHTVQRLNGDETDRGIQFFVSGGRVSAHGCAHLVGPLLRAPEKYHKLSLVCES